MMDAPILSVAGLHGWYGKSHILQGIDLAVGNGELLALLGRNGVGKTTTMRAISGTLGRTEGDVRLAGVPILGRPAHVIARQGLSLVPEHRGIFGTLTVEENLSVAARRGSPHQIPEYQWVPWTGTEAALVSARSRLLLSKKRLTVTKAG